MPLKSLVRIGLRMGPVTVVAMVLGAAAGCTQSANETARPVSFGSSQGLVTSGNLRLVTERRRNGQAIVCTEPAPDYAVAFDKLLTAKINIAVPERASGEASGQSSSTERVSELEGREAAVLALRDGLYYACQSYANGLIGHDAYAIILSQYGSLLTSLVGQPPTANTKQDAARAAVEARSRTLATLVVACISANDPTRDGMLDRSNGLLNRGFCARVLESAYRRSVSGI